jgi:hypothetical protein
MKNNLKKKNNSRYLLILPLLLLISCEKNDNIVTPPPPTLKKASIAFTWYYNSEDNPNRKILNDDNSSYYGGGQAYADVNNDGFMDMLLSYSNAKTEYSGIHWYINKGDNVNFESDTTFINGSTNGNRAHKILKTEINKDGKPDFITLGVDERIPGNYTGNFNVLLSTPTNKYEFKTIPNPNRYWFHNGTAGDLNGDGNVDVVAATFIWYGDGTGNFTKSNVELNKYTSAILVYEIFDSNGDGKNDIIVGGNDTYGNTTIIINNGTFLNAEVIKFDKHLEYIFNIDIEFIDLDSDGDLDIIELRADATQITTKIFAYINTNGTFVKNLAYFDDSLDGGGANGITDRYGWSTFKVDDMDGDGKLDIVAENFHDSKYNGYKYVGGKWVKYIFK